MSRTDTSTPSLPLRVLRGLLALAAVMVVAWVAGQLALASQIAVEARFWIGLPLVLLLAGVCMRVGGGRR